MISKNSMISLERKTRFFSEISKTNICQKCPICCSTVQKPVVDIKNAQLNDVDVLFISEASSEEDITYGAPFIGVSGLFFRKALHETGVEQKSIVLTNAVVCRPLDVSKINRIPSLTELQNCSERVKVFIETLLPKKICLVGAVSRDFYTAKLREWKIDWVELFMIHHPAYIIRLGGSTSEAYKEWKESIAEIFLD